jgi:prolyl oligopeptidase PreP (S9A serine peptidase family)
MTFTDPVSPLDVFEVDVRTGAVNNVTKNTPALHRRVPMPELEGVVRGIRSLDGRADIPDLLVSPVGADPADAASAPLLSFGYGAFGGNEPLVFKRFNLLVPVGAAMGWRLGSTEARGGNARGRMWAEEGRGASHRNTVHDRVAVDRARIARGAATPSRVVRLGDSAAGLDVAEMAMRYPELAAVGVLINPSAELLDADMRTYNRRISEYGDPGVPEQLARPVERDPELSVGRLPRDAAARLHEVLVVAAMGDDRVSPRSAMRLVAALQDAVRDIPGAGPVLFHGAGGGHTWTPTPTSVGILAAAAHAIREIEPARRALSRGISLRAGRAATRGAGTSSATPRRSGPDRS